MKKLCFAALMLCSSAFAAIPGIPRGQDECHLVGAVAAAVAELHAAGYSRSETLGRVRSTVARALPPGMPVPSWVQTAAAVAWAGSESVPDLPPVHARAALKRACLQ